MSSWRLFSYLTPYGSPRLHYAILRRELKRANRSVFDELGTWLREFASLGFVFMAFLCAGIWCVTPTFLSQHTAFLSPFSLIILIPITLLPSLALWIVPLGALLGPCIARERMNHTWDVLRVTPADTEMIVLGKTHAAMWRLYPAIRSARTVLLLASLAPAALSMNLLDSLTMTYTTSHGGICGAGIVFMLAGALIFMLDRMQQFTLMGAAALAISVSARSVERGTVSATLAAGIAWLVDVGIAVVLLAVLPRWVTLGIANRTALLVMLGPLGGYLAELHIHEATVCIAGTFIARELAIRALWRWTIHTAAG